jgi:hypothetical protein
MIATAGLAFIEPDCIDFLHLTIHHAIAEVGEASIRLVISEGTVRRDGPGLNVWFHSCNICVYHNGTSFNVHWLDLRG